MFYDFIYLLNYRFLLEETVEVTVDGLDIAVKMKRIFICGAHSTGKSTLVQQIAKRIPIHVESEVARKIIEDLKLKREDFDPRVNPARFEELQEMIIEAQSELEKQNALLGRSYISDRGPDPLIYAEMYLGKNKLSRLLSLPTTHECIDRFVTTLFFRSNSVVHRLTLGEQRVQLYTWYWRYDSGPPIPN